MKSGKRYLPFLTMLAVFGLAAGGRLAVQTPIEWSLLFGFYTAAIFSYVPSLVTASGFLQRKLFNLIFLLIVGLLLALFKRFVDVPLIGVGFYSVLSIAALWALDRRDSRKPPYVLAVSPGLSKKHRKPRLLMRLFTLFFRLLPCPTAIGLYTIGKPDERAAILVTGNFSLTLNRVVRALKRQNCRLLVCDSRGINIWCSTRAGHFDTESIVQAISLTGLTGETRNRTLVLPQLCAAGVSLEKLKQETGFNGIFGPVRIEDYPAYSADQSNREFRKVSFPVSNRIEMAFGTLLIPAVLLFFIFNFIDLSLLTLILPASLIISIVNAVTFPYRFIKNVYLWSLFFSAAIFGISHAIFSAMLEPPSLVYSITLGLVSLYLVNEFEGWSPLVKFDMFSSYRKPGIAVDPAACTGCGRCVQVCPKDVFELIDNRSSPVRLKECVSCTACLVQCPEQAISDSRH